MGVVAFDLFQLGDYGSRTFLSNPNFGIPSNGTGPTLYAGADATRIELNTGRLRAGFHQAFVLVGNRWIPATAVRTSWTSPFVDVEWQQWGPFCPVANRPLEIFAEIRTGTGVIDGELRRRFARVAGSELCRSLLQ